MKILAFFAVLFMDNICYEIRTVSEVQALLSSEGRDFLPMDSALTTNGAFVYQLRSGRVALVPNTPSPDAKALVFDNDKCFKEYVTKDSFPIGNENKSIEEIFQTDIEDVNLEIPGIIHRLRLLVDSNDSSGFSDPDSLSALLSKLKKRKNQLSQKDLFHSCLVLGEFVRQQNGGRWILLKRYGTFNPYYIPAIIYADDSIFLVMDYLNSFFENSSIRPEDYANLQHIKNPGLKLGNAFYRSNFFGYKILD